MIFSQKLLKENPIIFFISSLYLFNLKLLLCFQFATSDENSGLQYNNEIDDHLPCNIRI